MPKGTNRYVHKDERVAQGLVASRLRGAKSQGPGPNTPASPPGAAATPRSAPAGFGFRVSGPEK